MNRALADRTRSTIPPSQIALPAVSQTHFNYYIKATTDGPIPLSAFASIDRAQLEGGLASTQHLPGLINDSVSTAQALCAIANTQSLDTVSSLTGALLGLAARVIRDKYHKPILADYLNSLQGVDKIIKGTLRHDPISFIAGYFTCLAAVTNLRTRPNPAPNSRVALLSTPTLEPNFNVILLEHAFPISEIVVQAVDLLAESDQAPITPPSRPDE